MEEPRVVIECETRGNHAFLETTWQRFLNDDFSKYVHQLISVVIAHIEEATYLFKSYGMEHDWWDPISIHLPDLETPSIVRRIVEGPPQKMDSPHREYRIYGLLSKLNACCPNHPEVTDALAAITREHPEFRPIEAPIELKGGAYLRGEPPWVTLPFSTASLLALPAAEALDQLLAFEPDDTGDIGEDDVVTILQRAAGAKPDWGIEIASLLQDRGIFDTYLWRGIVAGFAQTEISIGDWSVVLNLLANHPRITEVATYEVAYLLEQGVSRESGGIPFEDLTLAATVGRKVWNGLILREWSKEQSDDWLLTAINDPAGIVTQFELIALNRLWKSAGDAWSGIPADWRAHWQNVIRDGSWTSAMGRILLASQVHVLFAMDQEWTSAEMPHVFAWDGRLVAAEQAWHGYLVWGSWSDEFLRYFLNCYTATFSHVGSNLGKHRARFCEHIAWIAVFGARNPLADGWLSGFIRTVGEEDRISWVSSVEQALKQVPSEKKQLVWDKWIKTYWTMRNQGQPLLPSGLEVSLMAGWLIHLGSAMPEALVPVS